MIGVFSIVYRILVNDFSVQLFFLPDFEHVLSHIHNICCSSISMAEDENANIISKFEKKKANPEKEGLNSYSKYAVGGESKEVPASALDENDNFIHRREQNQQKQKNEEP